MEVCPGGAAGLPCCAQRLARLHHLPGPDEEVLEVGVKRLLPAAVAQAEIVAVGRAPPGGRYDAVHRGQHLCPFRAGEVCAPVKGFFAGEGVGAPAVGVRDAPSIRPQWEADGLRRPHPFQRAALRRSLGGTGPQHSHTEQNGAERREDDPPLCALLSCPHWRPSCSLHCMQQKGQPEHKKAAASFGADGSRSDHFRKYPSRRPSRPVLRERLSVTTMGMGAGAAFACGFSAGAGAAG